MIKDGIYFLHGPNKLIELEVLGSMTLMKDGSNGTFWGFTEKIELAYQEGLLDYIGKV